ncbi:hypothetical protein D047_0781A, partial [Vibrio parahaemolyticus VPTS-2010_2]
MLIPNKAI